MATSTTQQAQDTPESPFRVVAGWKGGDGGALFHGSRLVTRSEDLDNLHRMKEDLERSGRRPFSSKVAPVVLEEPDDALFDNDPF